MEKFNELPEKWVVKATNDLEDEIICRYINDTFNVNVEPGLGDMDYWCYSNTSYTTCLKDDTCVHNGNIDHFLNVGVIEITYEQFVEYVLNHKKDDAELSNILIKLLS